MHLHNFCVSNVGYLFICVPPPFFFVFGYKHFVSFKSFTFTCFVHLNLFCAQTPCFVPASVFCKQTQSSLYNILQERRTETEKRENKSKRWGANSKLKFTENLYKKRILTQTSENDVSKSISIFTFIKELYSSIIIQIPAPTSKGCSVQD